MSGSPPRGFVAILAVVLLALAPRARAETHDAFYLRAGGVSEGPQHTLRSGYELGVGYDWPVGDRHLLGMGLAFADEAASSDSQAHAFSLEGHGRWRLTRSRVRPLLEGGLGYYWFERPTSAFLLGGRTTWAAPGAWLGIGAEAGIIPGLSARFGIAYHMVAQSITVSGGNLEDYFASGITLAISPRR